MYAVVVVDRRQTGSHSGQRSHAGGGTESTGSRRIANDSGYQRRYCDDDQNQPCSHDFRLPVAAGTKPHPARWVANGVAARL